MIVNKRVEFNRASRVQDWIIMVFYKMDSVYKMFVNLLFIYVNILSQGLPLNSLRFHIKVPKPHLVLKINLYLIDIVRYFILPAKLAKNISNRHICCRIILTRRIFLPWFDRFFAKRCAEILMHKGSRKPPRKEMGISDRHTHISVEDFCGALRRKRSVVV